MPPERLQRLHRTVAAIVGVAESEVTDETSPDTVSAWDSVTHLNLVMAIEEEFGVFLTPEEAMEMTSVKLIRLLLEEKES
ncbi:MAG: acyl carrier protein [Verrucomicrobiaceae bacterium]